MKQCKKMVSVLLCVLLLACAATGFSPVASAAEYDPSYGVVWTDSTTGFSYASLTASPEECIIIAYDGKNKDVVIPSTMPYSPQPLIVTGLKSMLFQNMDITSVSMPDTLTDIGQNVFSNCKQLTEVIIPDSVRFLGFGAFLNCTGLKKIQFGSGLTDTGSQVMMNCSSLEEATFKQGSTYIGTRFFRGCTALKKLVLADSVTTVGLEAFKECVNLEDVVIGNGVKNLDAFQFNRSTVTEPNKANTTLKSISIGGGVKKIPAKMFANCTSLKTVVFSEGLEEIDDRAFENCAIEGTVVLPDSVKHTRNYIFKDCNKIEELIVGKGLTDISYTFFQMRGLKRVIIPQTLTSIGYVAFGECTALEKVYIPKETSAIDTNAFGGFTHLTVYGYTGSAAQTYADSKSNVTFVALDGADKTALKAAIDKADRKIAEGLTQYTDQSVQAFETAYGAATTVYETQFANKQEIDKAEQDLTAATDALTLKVDKAALKAALDRADGIKADGLSIYTPDSVQAFETAYASALTVYNAPASTQAQVNTAEGVLTAKTGALTKKADKTLLKDALDAADAVIAQGLERYTQKSVEDFEEAYDAALTVYNNANAAQTDVDNAKDELNNAREALQVFTGDVDKTGLKAAIARADAVIAQGLLLYTPDSVQDFEDAYAEAVRVYKDEQAGQTVVNNAKDALDHAVEGLEKQYKTGDVDRSGEVNLQDVLLLQKYIARVVQLDDIQLILGDTDHNSKIEMNDVLQIQKYLSKMIPSLD